jgi:hypothetical protein
MNDDERALAAALILAIDAGLLSMTDAIRVVDREIENRAAPGRWLIDASVSATLQDLLHVLRPIAIGHPLLDEMWPLLEAMERSLSNGADPLNVARLVERFYPYGTWPAELDQPLYDVYEEATCAHEHGGVPVRQSVRKALMALFKAGRIRGDRSILERVLS